MNCIGCNLKDQDDEENNDVTIFDQGTSINGGQWTNVEGPLHFDEGTLLHMMIADSNLSSWQGANHDQVILCGEDETRFNYYVGTPIWQGYGVWLGEEHQATRPRVKLKTCSFDTKNYLVMHSMREMKNLVWLSLSSYAIF